MGPPAKIVKILALVVFLSVVILILSVVAFVKSPFFAKAVTAAINNYTDLHVEIGGLYFGDDQRIVVDALMVRQKTGDGLRLELPHAEISAGLRGIIRKHIDEIILVKPAVTFAYKKEKKARPSLPFTFSRVSVTDADVLLRLEQDREFRVSGLSVSLDRPSLDKNASLTARAFIDSIHAGLDVAAELDIDGFDFVEMKAELSPVDLGKAVKLYPTPFFKGKELQGTGKFNVEIKRKDESGGKVGYQASLAVQDMMFRSQALNIDLHDRLFTVESQGVYDTKEDSAEIMSLASRLSSTPLLGLQGTVRDLSSSSPKLDVDVSGSDIPLHEIRRIVSGPAVKRLEGMDLHGIAETRFAVTGTLRSPEIRGEGSIRGERFTWGNIMIRSFEIGLPFEYRNKKVSVRGASARAAESSFHDRKDNRGPAYKFMDLTFSVPSLLYSESLIKADNLQVRADRAGIYRDGKELYSEKALLMKGFLDGDLTKRRFRVKDISLGTDFFRGISGHFDMTAGKQTTINAAMRYEAIDLESISGRYLHNFFTEKGYAVSGKGSINMTVRAMIPENASSRVEGTTVLNVQDAGFSSADGAKAAEGLRMNARLDFKTALPVDTLDFSAEADATGFELLVGKFYGSFKERSLGFSAKGTYDDADGSLRLSESRLGLTGMGEMRATGRISGLATSPFFSMQIQVPEIDNARAYDLFIRETFQDQAPLLSRLDVNGKSSAQFSITGRPERFSARGAVQISDMNLAEKGTGKAVSGIRIDLPFDIEYPEASLKKEEGLFGSLTIEDLLWSGIHLKNIEIFPAIMNNVFVLRDDVVIPVMGGSVTLKDVSYGDMLSEAKRLSLAGAIKDIELDLLSAAFELPRFSGNLSGAIPKIVLVQDRLITEGQVDLAVFGGNIKVDNLSMDNVFSPIASLKTDIEVDGIHLEQLTGTFDFGHISGVIRGRIKDLVIVNGQAQRFIASVESYKEKGVSQKISVEALKKISILGTGTSPSVLDMGIYRFFRDYRYDRLGFRASLKNDNLLLLGIDNEGDKGYLVKGGFLPPKVDVINYTQNISFKEMVSRLKRIQQAER